MTARVRYRGQTYSGRIIDKLVRYGETFYIVACDAWKVEKWVHASAIIKANAA